MRYRKIIEMSMNVSYSLRFIDCSYNDCRYNVSQNLR